VSYTTTETDLKRKEQKMSEMLNVHIILLGLSHN